MVKKIKLTQELIDQYAQEKEDTTSEIYLIKVKETLQVILRKIESNEFTPVNISSIFKQNYIERRIQKKQDLTKKMSTNSLRSYFTRVVSYLNWYLGKEHPLTKAFLKYKREIPETEKEVKQISQNSIDKLFFHHLTTNYEFLLWVSIVTAARREALAALNIENIKFIKLEDQEEILQRITHKKRVEYLNLYGPEAELVDITRYEKHKGKKSKQEITVTLTVRDTRKFSAFLEKRTKTEKQLKKKELFKDQNGHYLFWNRWGNRMNIDSISSFFSRLKKRTGIDINCHDGRKRAIQYLYASGVRIETIRKISGHSRKSRAINRYFDPTRQTATTEIFDKIDENRSEENNDE